MKPRILIDATVLTNEFRHRGVGNLAFSLIRHLLKDESVVWCLVAPGDKHHMIKELGYESQADLPGDFEFFSLGTGGGLLFKLLRPLYFNWRVMPQIRRARPDLYLSLNVDYGVPLDIPTLAYLHDVTPLKSGIYSQKNFLANYIKKMNYQWAIRRAKRVSKVLTISEFTKNDIVSVGFPEENIVITHLAISEEVTRFVENLPVKWEEDEKLKRRTLNIYNIAEPYICYVGGLEANKNVDQVLKSFTQIADKYPGLRLVIGGGEFKLGWDHKATPLNERAERIFSLAKELKIAHRVIYTGFIEQQHLPIILKHARCFIHLSKYEGFGLAVLEPQLVGTPVVAADATSYPEVLKDSALLVDPDDTDQVAKALSSLLNDDKQAEELRTDLISKGQKNIKRFSWDDTAKTVVKVIKSQLNYKKAVVKSVVQEKVKVEIKDKKEKNMKAVVLAAYFHPFRGGMEQVALDYAKFLVMMGYELTVVTSDRKQKDIVINKDEEYKFEQDGKEYSFKIKRLKRKGRNYYFYRLQGLYAALKDINPGVIHMHGFGFAWHDLSVARFKRFVNRDVVVINTPHGPFMSKEETGLRQILKASFNLVQSLYLPRLLNAVIQVNPEQYQWISNTYGVKEKKVHFMTPIMPQPAQTFKQLQKHKADKDHIQITSLGRLADYKGYDDIVAAFNDINTATPTKLIIAGKSENFEKELAEIIGASPRREDIRLEKDVSDKRRDEILQDTDIFVFASQWEAFGIVLAEAMAQACAVISTDTEGGRFLVTPGKNGLIFSYKDIRKLVDEINILLNDKKKLQEMQENSYNMVGDYSAKVMYEKYKDLIDKLT